MKPYSGTVARRCDDRYERHNGSQLELRHFMRLDDIPFMPGLTLSRRYHDEVVGPLIKRHFPDLPYAAARIDGGSDVLGFDTPLSRDHDWGPRITLYLIEQDLKHHGEAILDTLRRDLPLHFCGYPTNFERNDDGSLGMAQVSQGPVNPYITVTTVSDFFLDYLAYDPSEPPGLEQWLTFPEQRLRTIRSGRVYHDDLKQLTSARKNLHYYPLDLWLYLLAVAWRRIDQEDPFMGRAGDVGDDLGSRLIAARQIYNVMRLSFLMEKEYATYSKWLGTAFSRLEISKVLSPLFESVWTALNWQHRQAALTAIYEIMARKHNQLGITPPLRPAVDRFHERPYFVIHADRFVEAIMAAIGDNDVRALPAHLGGIDQFIDSTDVLAYSQRTGRILDFIEDLKGEHSPEE